MLGGGGYGPNPRALRHRDHPDPAWLANSMPDSMFGSAAVAGLGAAGLMLCISSKLQDRRVDSSRQHRLDPALQDRGKALPLLLQKRALKDNTKYGEEQYVYRVCLTGGPCGGKSSSQEALSKALTAEGYNVFFAPEVPTILMNGGCQYPGLAPENKAQLTAFEDGIIQMQLQMERSFTRIAASTGKPSTQCVLRAPCW